MRLLFCIIFFPFLTQSFAITKPCGTVSKIDVWPNAKKISKNSIIYIELWGEYRRLLNELTINKAFSLASNLDTVRIFTITIDTASVYKYCLFFKPEKSLKVGSTYKLVVSGMKDLLALPNNHLSPSNEKFGVDTGANWTVVNMNDVKVPIWNNQPAYLSFKDYPIDYWCNYTIACFHRFDYIDESDVIVKSVFTKKNGQSLITYNILMGDRIKIDGDFLKTDFFTPDEITVDFFFLDASGNSSKKSEQTLTFLGNQYQIERKNYLNHEKNKNYELIPLLKQEMMQKIEEAKGDKEKITIIKATYEDKIKSLME